jgi:chromatin segregation and condensation protein Rec8/ScpA/Scc1 (kleisin family)
MAENIEGLPVLYRDTFCRGNSRLEGREDYDLLGLCVAFFELIAGKEERFIVVRDIRPTLEEKIEMLRSILDSLGEYIWDMKDGEGQNEKVATILGILELTKQQQVTLFQRRPFGKIVVKKRILGDNGDSLQEPADYTAN